MCTKTKERGRGQTLIPNNLCSNYNDSINFTTVKEDAYGRWPGILAAIGIDTKYLKNKHGPCPCCGGKNRFRFDNKNGSGSFYCNNCGAGHGFKLVQLFRRCNFREAERLVSDVLGCKEIAKSPRRSYSIVSPEGNQKLIQLKREQMHKIWNEAGKIAAGDAVHKYLTITRKLLLPEIPAALRIHPALAYWEDKKCLGTFPTMLAKIENINGELVGLHRTYLTPDGKKAFGDKSKKFMSLYEGALAGAAIRLYEPTNTLILAEGIETALYGYIATGLPAWAGRCDQGLAAVKLPDSVRKVIALIDNDKSGAGQRAGEKLAARMKREGRLIKRLMSPQPETDWLDLAVGKE